MSPSRQKRNSLLALVIFFAVPCAAKEARHLLDHCEDTYTASIRLMRVFYPELSGKNTTMDIKAQYPFDADGPLLAFYVGVSESDQAGHVVAQPYANPSSADKAGHLWAHFQFDGRDHRVFLLFVTGSFVNSDREQKLQKKVNEHPDWRDPKIAEALALSGAKFGPDQKEALLAKFPAKGLEPILGKIEMGPAWFDFRSDGDMSPHAVLEWSVRFWARTDDKSMDEFTASFEPFEGKLVSLGRRPLENGKR